jgi:hypothetical protein
MFQIVPEPEFEIWYAELLEPVAEEVTAALDLIAAAGATLMPERLSRLLLWYDGVGDGASEGQIFGTPYTYRMLAAQRARDYVEWRQEALLTLESSAFRKRLRGLSPELCEQVLLQVERLKRTLKSSRTLAALNPVSAAERALQRDFLALLGLMELEPAEVFGCGSGLRELTISNVTPALRILVGLDFPERRLLAILGEPLDRRYYGDSVRRAEARWSRYLNRSPGRREVSK